MPEPPDFAPNAAVYDDAYYAAMYRPHWFFRNARKYRERDAALLRAVRPHAGMRLLEVGSARGDTAFFFAPLVAAVVGVDAAPVAVEAARAAAAARSLANVTFEVADARRLPGIADASFDAVLLADFVEHVTDEVLVPCLAEARRLLVPGGALAIYTPNRDHWAERIKAGRPGPPAGGPHRGPALGRGRPPRGGGGLLRRRPLLLRKPLSAPRGRRPAPPRRSDLPLPDRPPRAPSRLKRPRARTPARHAPCKDRSPRATLGPSTRERTPRCHDGAFSCSSSSRP